MNREAIIEKANSKLPNIEECKNYMIIVPILKELGICLNNEIAQKENFYYEVTYQKCINNNNEKYWKLININY